MENSPKKVLITGAAGFIGSHLCERFLQEEYRVIGMDNFLTGSPDNIAHLLQNKNFRFIEYDVTNFLYVAEELDAILHFACPASPVEYMRYPIETMKVDSIGTYNTLTLAKSKQARYVLASTSEIYGDPEVHPQTESYWGNVNPIGPRSVYDEAKRFSEAMAMAYFRTHQLDTRICRIFNTYGPRMALEDGRVVPNFLTQALKGEALTVFGDGSQTRSFCYVSDLVEAIFRLTTTDEARGEVINLGNPGEYTIAALAQVVCSVVGCKMETIARPLPPDDPRKRRPDIAKATEMLDWKPSIPLKEGLEKTLFYFQQKLDSSKDSEWHKVCEK